MSKKPSELPVSGAAARTEQRARSHAQLRAEYPVFIYEGFEWCWDSHESLRCSFLFRNGELSFRPTCRFTFAGRRAGVAVAREVLDGVVFRLGLAELPSYWKATCSPRVEVRAGSLTADEVAYWKVMLTDGMSEFHYVNETPFTDPDFVTIVAAVADRPRQHAPHTGNLDTGYVVPVGGGKDSLLTLALLGRRNDPVATIAINPPPSTHAAIELANVHEQVVVERRIDPRLLELNRSGYLNGHTPFGAVIGFTSALAALVLGRKNIVLSNESSSDYAKLAYRGATINHQYGKSTAFERAIRAYLKQNVASDLHYFSILRPFNELQIAQRFSELTAFYPVFRSCNRGRKTDSWCGACPKCLSTFILLAPFMPHTALVEAVGKDMLEDSECMAMLPSLLGEDGTPRPFECVATPAELRAALALRRGEPLSESTLRVLTQTASLDAMSGAIPRALQLPLMAALRPRVVPLLDGAAVGVVGLGREGVSTCRHLLSTVDALDLTVIDDDPSVASRLPPPQTSKQRVRFIEGPHAAQEAPPLDIVFKSPGVPAAHPSLAAYRKRPTIVTSNTSLFFECCRGTTIGVTGTKGKSTTASLIAHVMRAAGHDTRLIGNIGRPCLDGLEDGDAESLYCVELSSFQLEDLEASPDIAVVLGVFADHLDRHGDMASYVAAKSAITRYQGRRDLVLYNADCSRAAGLAELSPARRVSFTREQPPLLAGSPSPLLGGFNNYNIWPAIHIGRLFGIPDVDLAASIRSFRALPGRLETVTDKDGLRFVCDIRSTAPEVTVAALDALADEVKSLFLGGVDRQQDYSKLVPALRRSAVEHIVLFPPTGARIREVLTETALSKKLKFFEPRSMEDAVRYVYQHAPAGRSVCLMSTAAPSDGGLFSGPEDKARQFAHWSRKLGREVSP